MFDKIKKERPDVRIGLIDSGNYTPHINEFHKRVLKLDWMDISVDGTSKSHNMQRDPVKQGSFDVAMNGLRYAREITVPPSKGGRVTSLFTVTKFNFNDLYTTANLLFLQNDEPFAVDPGSGRRLDLIDEFHITTMSPVLPENLPIEIDTNEMRIVWGQVMKLYTEHLNEGREDVFFRIYRAPDIVKLADAVGRKKFWAAITNTDPDDPYSVDIGIGFIRFYIDKVPALYYPLSTFPNETFLIDADATCRLPYCQKYSIVELRSGQSKSGEDTTKYSVKQLDQNSSYADSYLEEVDWYWANFGKKALEKEAEIMDDIKNST